MPDHPEEAEQDHAARQHGGVELDTPDTGGDRGTAEEDGHPVRGGQGPPGVGAAMIETVNINVRLLSLRELGRLKDKLRLLDFRNILKGDKLDLTQLLFISV